VSVRERRLVLCDFGFSTEVDVEGRAAMQIGMGTEGYMAPEVLKGWSENVTTAADVYSAGIALGKLRRAHSQCAAMRTLVNRMCSSYSYMRPSAAAVLDVWRREVTPALLSTVGAASCSASDRSKQITGRQDGNAQKNKDDQEAERECGGEQRLASLAEKR
jgi:serine/threonine protein kinase